MRWRWLTCWLAGALALSMVAWPTAATADLPAAGAPSLTVPAPAFLAGGFAVAGALPAPELRVVQLPGQLSPAQFQEVVDELERSTPVTRTVVVAPSFVSMTSPPSAELVAQLAASSGPNSAAVVLTPGGPGNEATFNAAALLYARIPDRMLIGTITLQPGVGGSWPVLQHDFPGCFPLCAPLSDGQPVGYPGLLADGGQRVGSAADLAADLPPEPQASMTWERLGPVTASAFAPLFPAAPVATPRPRPASSPGLAEALIAALIFGFLVGGAGVLLRLRRRKRRRSSRSRRANRRHPLLVVPMRPSSDRPARRNETDRNAFLPMIGAGDVVDAAVRSGFSPDGYVEIDDCLVRATWSDSTSPPLPGQTVIARLVNGAVQATHADASTHQPER